MTVVPASFPLLAASGDVSVHFGGSKCKYCCCFLFVSLEQLVGLHAVKKKEKKERLLFLGF